MCRPDRDTDIEGGDPYSRIQITQITAGFSPIDPALMQIQPLVGSELLFLTNTAEAPHIDRTVLLRDQSVKILLLSA